MKASTVLSEERQRFEKTIQRELDFINALPQLVKRVPPRIYPLNKSLRSRLCEMSFLVIFIAWEEFVESTFEQYLLLRTNRPSSIRPKISVKTLAAAQEVIRTGRSYVEWSNPDKVRERAQIFYKNGEPYESTLGGIISYLKSMLVVRNRSVHHSDNASKQFDDLIRGLYGHRRKLTPGSFLLEPPPPAALPPIQEDSTRPSSATPRYASMFELYAKVLATACKEIVP